VAVLGAVGPLVKITGATADEVRVLCLPVSNGEEVVVAGGVVWRGGGGDRGGGGMWIYKGRSFGGRR
jgi:hypothetical protein